MSTRQNIQALVEATARGQAALTGGYGEKAAARELKEALHAVGDSVDAVWADELRQGIAMMNRLRHRLSLLDDATVRTIRPCPSCKSTDLLLMDSCMVDGIAMIVCSQCGDTRLWCPAPATLRNAKTEHGDRRFRAISVPGGDAGPFR